MSRAPRLARWNSRSRSWAGQDRAFGQRQSTSPSSRARMVPQAGQPVGNSKARSVPLRRSTTGAHDLRDHVAGLAQHDHVADQHALARQLVGVVQGGPVHRGPADQDRLHHRERGDPPGAAHVDLDVEQPGGDLLRRVLVGDRPPGCPAGRAERALQGEPVELDDHAVDLVRRVVPVLAVVLDVLPDAVQVLSDLEQVTDRQPPAAQPLVPARVGDRRVVRTALVSAGHRPPRVGPARPARAGSGQAAGWR